MHGWLALQKARNYPRNNAVAEGWVRCVERGGGPSGKRLDFREEVSHLKFVWIFLTALFLTCYRSR